MDGSSSAAVHGPSPGSNPVGVGSLYGQMSWAVRRLSGGWVLAVDEAVVWLQGPPVPRAFKVWGVLCF